MVSVLEKLLDKNRKMKVLSSVKKFKRKAYFAERNNACHYHHENPCISCFHFPLF